MLEHPPVELQQIDPLETHAIETSLNAGPHYRCCHRPRFRAPFGEGGWRLAAGCRHIAAAGQIEEASRDDLGAAVMVGHVETVEACPGVIGHGCSGTRGIEGLAASLHIGDLPQPGNDAADLEAGA